MSKRRRYHRVVVENLAASLSDGADSCMGTVSNISRNGLLLNDIPQTFKSRSKKLTILVSAKGKTLTMQIEPKWLQGHEAIRKMGAVILDPPLDWTLFVLIREPGDEDIWAASSVAGRL